MASGGRKGLPQVNFSSSSKPFADYRGEGSLYVIIRLLPGLAWHFGLTLRVCSRPEYLLGDVEESAETTEDSA